MRSDLTMQLVAVLGAGGLVVLSRRGSIWWHLLTARERHPARTARLLVTGAAVVGGTALVVGMASPTPPSDRRARTDDATRAAPGWQGAGAPLAASPDPSGAITSTFGS